MIREKDRLLVSILAVAALLVASACAPVAPPPTPTTAPAAAPAAVATKPPEAIASPTPIPPQATPTTKPVTVRVSSVASMSDAPIYIATQRGYFKEVGVDVELVTFQSGPLTIPAVAQESLEVGGGTIGTSLFNAVDRGIALKLVATKGSSKKPTFAPGWFIVRKDLYDSGQIKEIKDLKGRKIAGASLQSTNEALAANIFKQGGFTAKDVEWVLLPFPEMLAALANKAIDGGILVEPTLTTALEMGLVARWPQGDTSAAYGGEQQSSLMIFSATFSKNTDAARRFMVGYVKGLRAYNDAFVKGKDRDSVISILTKNTALKDSALYSKIGMFYMEPDGKMHLPSMQMDLDYFKEMGYYTGKLELKQMIDTQFIDYAVQQLGPYK